MPRGRDKLTALWPGLVLVLVLASACSKPPSVQVSAVSGSGDNTIDGPTVKPGGRFDVTAYQNSSIGDNFQIIGVENGHLDGSDSSSSGATGGGSEIAFHIVAGDTPGPGKVTVRYCYRGCGHETKDGHPEHTDVVKFTVG